MAAVKMVLERLHLAEIFIFLSLKEKMVTIIMVPLEKDLDMGHKKGCLVAQGNADARAGIRLSGADIIIGGICKEATSLKKRLEISEQMQT